MYVCVKESDLQRERVRETKRERERERKREREKNTIVMVCAPVREKSIGLRV